MKKEIFFSAAVLSASLFIASCGNDDDEAQPTEDSTTINLVSEAQYTFGDTIKLAYTAASDNTFSTTALTITEDQIKKGLGVSSIPSDLEFYAVAPNRFHMTGSAYYTSTTGFYFNNKGYGCSSSDEDVKIFIDFNGYTLNIGQKPDACAAGLETTLDLGICSGNICCPIAVKVSIPATVDPSDVDIDMTKNPADITLVYEETCNASSTDYSLGTINLLTDGNFAKLAQAFVMKSEDLTAATLAIANGSTVTPAEGKIALGLLQSDRTISYTYTANSGFYITAEGMSGSWSNNDPLWFEYDTEKFVITYGHKPGYSTTGTSYTIKPILVYTKNGTQYKATFEITMKF